MKNHDVFVLCCSIRIQSSNIQVAILHNLCMYNMIRNETKKKPLNLGRNFFGPNNNNTLRYVVNVLKRFKRGTKTYY